MSKQTAEITLEMAKKMYKGSDDELKEFALKLFPDLGVTITDKIKTFDDALAIVGASDNLKILLDYNGQDEDMLAAVALAKLTIIAKALNEGWKPDWTNSNEWKYYAWFKMGGSSGVGFSCDDYGSDRSNSRVGSRLAFKSSELAIYAAKQFTDLYKDLMTIK